MKHPNLSKLTRSSLAAIFCLSAALCPLQAESLNKNYVAADTKWLAHLDVDALRGSQIGGKIFKSFLEKPIADLQAFVSVDLGREVYEKVNSITAYGTTFAGTPQETGVIIVKAEAQAQAALERLIDFLKTANPTAVAKEEQEKGAIYTLNGTTYLALTPDQPWIISSSRDLVEAAQKVIRGQAKNLSSEASFPQLPGAALLQFAATSISSIAGVPEQARGVQEKLENGALWLTEGANQVTLDLALKAKSTEIAPQLKQVLDGLVGLVALSQSENADLQELVKGTKVTESGDTVQVKMQYSLAKVLIGIDSIPR